MWSALNGGWAAHAQGDVATALRLDPDYGPFAAAADDAQRAALVPLIPDDGPLWIVEPDFIAAPPGAIVTGTASCDQMVAARVSGDTEPFEALGEDDADAIRTLVALTEPGPFGPLTHRIGGFIGIREQGAIVAIAGERMRAGGFAEVSGVCTHPDFRGRGYAARLMRAVMRRIADRGETPFLHAYSENRGAIGLYESLGFVFRRPIAVTKLARALG